MKYQTCFREWHQAFKGLIFNPPKLANHQQLFLEKCRDHMAEIVSPLNHLSAAYVHLNPACAGVRVGVGVGGVRSP